MATYSQLVDASSGNFIANTTGDIKARHMQEAWDSVLPYTLVAGVFNFETTPHNANIGYNKLDSGSAGRIETAGFGLPDAPDMYICEFYGNPCQGLVNIRGTFSNQADKLRLFVRRANSDLVLMQDATALRVDSNYHFNTTALERLETGDKLFMRIEGTGPFGPNDVLTVTYTGVAAFRPIGPNDINHEITT